MISKFFIERPVLANVLAILMVVIGAVALMRLAVAQYPNVVPPSISVTTRYPGASARAVSRFARALSRAAWVETSLDWSSC